MTDETLIKLEEDRFDTMWELVSDVLLKISGKLDKAEKFQKVFSPYMLCRWLSMRQELMPYVDLLNTINTNSGLTNQQFYKLAYQLIPRQKNDYIKYIKKAPHVKKEENDINSIDEVQTSIFDI